MKIHTLYKIIEEPWGGINTFFKNFIRYGQRSNELDYMADYKKADLILTAGHYYAPGKMLGRNQICNLSHGRWLINPMGYFMKKGSKKIVFRVDGLRQIYAGQISVADRVLTENIKFADSIVFQSRFSRECFDKVQISYPEKYCIIKNGTDSDIFFPADIVPEFSTGLIAVSNSWSTNLKKGFEIISSFSELENVTILHIGRWPEHVQPKKVKLLGAKTENEIAQILRTGHVFLFPSEFEACSNTVVEALASGLPVIYHQSGGTPELCGKKYGLPLPAKPLNNFTIDNFTMINIIQELMDRYSEMRKAILDDLYSFSFECCFKQYINFFKQVLH